MAVFMNRKAQLALRKSFIMAACLAILSCLPAMAASLVMLGKNAHWRCASAHS